MHYIPVSLLQVDMRRSLNNFAGAELAAVAGEEQESPEHDADTDTVENVSNALNNLTVAEDEDEDEDEEEEEADNDREASLHLRHHRGVQFQARQFHAVTGANVSLGQVSCDWSAGHNTQL